MTHIELSMKHALLIGSSALIVAGTATPAFAGNLFNQQGNAVSNSASHIQNSRSVKINRGALQHPTLTFDLDGQSVTAVRTFLDTSTAGQVVWTGHLQGDSGNTVIFAGRGNFFSGVVHTGADVYELRGDGLGGQVLNKIDLSALPREDLEGVPDGGGQNGGSTSSPSTLANVVDQDLLMVYTQQACTAAGGVNDANCEQIRLNTIVAVNDLNASYQNSGVNIQMNLVGMALTNYDETGKSASQTLTDLRVIGDGLMDDVHVLRDSVGADIVAMLYNGPGCGIGYAPSNAATAFSVTLEACQVGNRTMAHEIGHNQGALHDRAQHGGGTVGDYNYGFRRCADGSAEDLGAPYFRTIMSYSCSGAPRVGRISNPNVNYAGVPQGIDPLIDPNKAAYNARTLNESAAFVAGFRNTVVASPPAAPTGLSAVSPDPYVVLVSWTDVATDEQYYIMERSDDNITWNPITQLGINSTSFIDFAVAPDTDYYYRIYAHNSGGDSAFDGPVMVTTQALPTTVEDVAISESFTSGTVSNAYQATHSDNGIVQTITEVSAGGPKPKRKQAYTHQWNFNVTGGAGGVFATVNAYVSGSEGANFDYTVDGGSSWNPMFTVNETASNTTKTFFLPGLTSGPMSIRVRDAAQTQGEAVDSVFVDSIIVTSDTQAGTPPAAPSNMTLLGASASSVDLQFTDNSSDEFGFEVWRNSSMPASCSDGTIVDTAQASAGTGVVNYTDESVSPSTTYWYFAKAFNGAGDNGACSNAVSATTPVAPNISAGGNGYKVKGKHTVDLTWSGAVGTNVDVVRDGNVVAQPTNSGAYTDNIGAKGGATYIYEICETGSSVNCSAGFSVNF